VNENIEILNILRVIMSSGIVLTYSLSIYWGTLFLIKTKWQSYSWLKLYTTVACFLMVLLYSYYLGRFIMGSPADITLVGVFAVRPIILFLGGSLASNARARYCSLLCGGENWTLLK